MITPARGRTWTVERMAAGLLDAADSGSGLAPLTAQWPELDVATAYAIQDELLRLRLDRGERIIGVKLERVGTERFGPGKPLTAWLTDAMVLPAGAPLRRDRMIRPRAEPEIVFQAGARLSGPGATAATALAAVTAVTAAVEVVDSRYTTATTSPADAVADNLSSCRFVTGPVSRPPAGLDLALEACLVNVDGQVVDSATGAAVSGHPAEALASAVNDLARRGLAIQAGWLVLTGAMTDAVPCPAGTSVSAHFTNLGSVFLT